MQSLEARRLLASAAVTAGELLVTGNATTANTINVALSSDSTKYTVKLGSTTQSFAVGGITQIHVIGGSTGDSITIGSTVSADSFIESGAGNDTVTGGAGSDNDYDSGGANLFTLNGGDDFVSAGSGNDTINGGDGNDIAFGSGGSDKFSGGTGNDTFDGGDGTDTADGGSGTDITLNVESRTSIEYHPGLAPNVPAAAKSTLNNGTLTIVGLTSGVNVVNIVNLNGSLTVVAGATRTTFTTSNVKKIVANGGSAADYIAVDSSLAIPASINGGGGDDTIVSSGGNDTINGGDGNDRITTQGGTDYVASGAGNDIAYLGSGNDTITGDAGTDRIDGSSGTDTASSSEYSVSIETSGTVTPPPTDPTPTDPTPTDPGPTNPSASTPNPVISAMTRSLVVGQSLFVNGLSSSYGNGNQDTAHFEWNFGDTGSEFNTLVGFNAGHVYAKAGTYTVTLKLWNERMGFKQTSITVNVAAAGRTAIYVSNSGSDSSSGGSTGSPVKTAARAFALARGKSNVDILFDGGDTFGVSDGQLIGGSNIRVGSYGSGKATLKWTGPRNGDAILTIVRGSVGCIVENLNIDTIYPGPDSDRSGIPVGVDVIGEQSVIRNLTFLNIGYAIQTNKLPTGVMVLDCNSPNLYGLRNYLLWAQGEDFVVLGNKAVNSTNEHPIRVFGVDRMLIAYNDLANPQAYSWETSKTALNIQKGNDVYVYGNTLRGPRWQIGPLGGADSLNDKAGRLNDIVVENNKIFNTQVEIVHGVSNLYIRNNVFDFSGGNALRVDGYDSTYQRGVNNLQIANNTFVNDSSQGRLLAVLGKVNGIRLVNNLYRADDIYMGTNGTAVIWVNGASLMSSFTEVSNNVWPVPNVSQYVASRTPGGTGIMILSEAVGDLANYYNINRWNALSQVDDDFQDDVTLAGNYSPTSDQSLLASGIRNYAGVFGDFYGKARPLSGAWTIGAVQL
jgi:hypothetical protein